MIIISGMMGTLTTGSPVLGLLDWVRHNQSRTQAGWHMAAMLPSYLLVKAGLIEPVPWGQRMMINSLGWVKDANPARLEQAAEWAVEHDLWPKRRPDVIEVLSAHARAGAQVLLASSIIEPMAVCFARRFGAQAIGTPLRYENGRARLATQLVASERKIEQVLNRLNVTRIDYAYGDTHWDIPLLEHADHPVAVYPDARLLAVARERGWEVLGEPQ